MELSISTCWCLHTSPCLLLLVQSHCHTVVLKAMVCMTGMSAYNKNVTGLSYAACELHATRTDPAE